MSQRGPAKKKPEEEEPVKRLLFDASHNEVLDITSDEYKPLREFLKQIIQRSAKKSRVAINLPVQLEKILDFPRSMRFALQALDFLA